MKITILFNCQHLGLANAMRALRPDLEIQSFELALYNSDKKKSELSVQLEGADAVISPVLGHEWGGCSTQSLRAQGRKHYSLMGVSFAGYHPDTVYVLTSSGHLQAATGPYHSRLAIVGYLAGLSAEETMGLFNKLVFSRLGYFDAFQQSRSFLINQFKIIGVDLAPYFDAWVAKGCFMHSINHPKIYVLCDLAVIAYRQMGIEVSDDRTHVDMVPDNLAFHVQMPVYPEIAKPLGIKGHMIFKGTIDGRNCRFMSLEDYIRSCFKVYASTPRDVLLKANDVANAMQKLVLEAESLATIA